MAEVKTTNDMTNYDTGAVRDTGGKGRMDLLPMCALLRVSQHMENALTHYPERNWESGLPMHTMLDSAMRHLVKYMDGMKDEDHLCAAATNLLMAMWTEEKKPEMQDIPTRPLYYTLNPATSPEKDSTVCPHWRTEFGKEYSKSVCWGTKELEECTCAGDMSKCDFYPRCKEHQHP